MEKSYESNPYTYFVLHYIKPSSFLITTLAHVSLFPSFPSEGLVETFTISSDLLQSMLVASV